MTNKEYSTFEELISAYKNGEIKIPKNGKFYIHVDNASVTGIVHPGWDEDGEELGEPEYIFSYKGRLQAFIAQILELMNLPTQEA